jgi:hypothetical protein
VTRKHYCQIWSYIATLIGLFAALAWARITGLPVSWIALGLPPSQSTLLSTPILALLILVGCFVTYRYQRQFPSRKWPERFPLFRLDLVGFAFSKPDARLYQASSLAIFFVFPIIALGVLYARFFDNAVYCNHTNTLVLQQASLFPIPLAACESFLRFGSDSGPQYYLWFSPWFTTCLVVAAVVADLSVLVRIFRR